MITNLPAILRGRAIKENVDMTIEQFWQKYNHCPMCRSYVIQGTLCDGCKWMWGNGRYTTDTDMDLFKPTDEARERMNREINEWMN